MTRTVRILGVATLLAFLFRLSQQVAEAWGHPPVEGYSVALGVVTVLFLIRASATEYAGKDIPLHQKDILWGISLGAFLSLLTRLLNGR